jgi:ATP synthase protein I
LGALLGVAVVIPFFTVGQVVLARIMQKNPAMGLTVAMMLYLAKIGVLAILLVILADVSGFDTKVFAVNILFCTLIWTGAEVWTFANTKVLYVDPENVPDTLKQRGPVDLPESDLH